MQLEELDRQQLLVAQLLAAGARNADGSPLSLPTRAELDAALVEEPDVARLSPDDLRLRRVLGVA
jgi:hypothetical protein